MSKNLENKPKKFRIITEGIINPEGPVLGPDGNIYFVSAEESNIYMIDNQNKISSIGKTNGRPNGLAFNSNGECEDYLVGTVVKTHATLNFEVKLGEDNKRYLYSKSDNMIAKGSCIKIDIDLEIN